MSDAAVIDRPQSSSTDLIIALPKVMTAETFTDEAQFEALYGKVKEAVAQHEPDVSTKTGRDAIASLAYKVARTKTALVKQGKALTEDWREKTKKVNAACNVIEDRLDALKEEARRPLTEWETKEAARVEKHEAALAKMTAYGQTGIGHPSTELKAMLAEVEATPAGDAWEEFAPKAAVAKEYAADTLKRLIALAEKQEAEAEELERLRAEKVERDRQEAERLASEQAINQKRGYAKRLIQHCKQCALGMIDGKSYPYPILFRELEEKIVIDEACGDLAGDVETARQEALATLRASQKADHERQEAERVASEAKLAEEARERAEREAQEKVAAAERAAKEADERAQREIEEAKARAEREAEAERNRIAEQKAAEEAEQRRREADKEHRRAVNKAVVAELIECSGIAEAKAQKIVMHIVAGLVPHVTLKY